MEVSEKDIKEYKSLHNAHLTDTSCSFTAHSAREKRMAEIANKYNMSNNTFLWQVISNHGSIYKMVQYR